MICKHCGTEHALDTVYVCRDVLKAQLASMTKRVEEVTRQLERLIFLLNAAEAKLATAVETLKWYRDQDEYVPPGDLTHVFELPGRSRASDTLRALAAARKETP